MLNFNFIIALEIIDNRFMNELNLGFTNCIAKIQQLLRLYRCLKNTNPYPQPQIKMSVRQQCCALLKQLEKQPQYNYISNKILNLIQQSLTDPKKNIQQSMPKRKNEKIGDKTPMRFGEFGISMMQKVALQKGQCDDKSVCSNQSSSEPILISFCKKIHSVPSSIMINTDLLSHMDQHSENVYLLGVNVPSPIMSKVSICTLMKFTSKELQASNYAQTFLKEKKEFDNNIRYPFGLALLGTLKQVQPCHLVFLAAMRAPAQLIILVQDTKNVQGKVYFCMNERITQLLRSAEPAEVNSGYKEAMLRFTWQNAQLQTLQIAPAKQIVTKVLGRPLCTSTLTAPNAIQISGSLCIHEQSAQFPYKFHSKFYTLYKQQFGMYFVKDEVLSVKKSFAQLSALKKQALQSENCILFTTVYKQSDYISKEFLLLSLECKKRDNYILINLYSLQNRPTAIIQLKCQQRQIIINTPSLTYKDFEGETPISKCILIITKNNFKQYECDHKLEFLKK